MASERKHSPQTEVGDDGVALTLDHLTRRYGDHTAVDDVSFAVCEGEFFTLVGPSGSGKTTILRLIAGLENPDIGRVGMFGTDVTNVPPEERSVGIVFQDYALFPMMTVAENVGYGLRFVDPPEGVSRAERVAAMLDLVDLAGFEERSIDQLSGGQQQRVALARALAPAPDVLLLDEPLSALDAQLRDRLRRTIKAIQNELAITTVYVTHDQAEALAISDRVAVLNEGACEQIANPQRIYHEPTTRFVAGFVGDNTIFTGTVTELSDDSARSARRLVRLRVDGATVPVAINTDRHPDVAVGNRVTCSVPASKLQRGSGKATLTCEVRDTEFLGDYYRVHADWNGRPVTVHAQNPVAGTIEVGINPETVHVISVDGR